MEYYIINKIQVINGSLTETQIGYVTTQEDVDYIDLTHNIFEYIEWVEVNKTDLNNGVLLFEDFFTPSNPIIYKFSSLTNYIVGNEITNLNNPED